MSPQLRKSIQNFLTDYQNKLTELSKLGLNGYEWDDSNTWLEKATRLLQQSIVEDYKAIPQDQEEWHYTKPIVGIDDISFTTIIDKLNNFNIPEQNNEGQPIMIDSWDDKVKRSINNEKENY